MNRVLTSGTASFDRRARRLAAIPAALVFALSLAACGGEDSEPEQPPTEVLTGAKEKVDAASSMRLKLSTDSVPTTGNAVLSATGTGTHPPAFEGDVKVTLNGLLATVPVVAVDGKVHAKLPLTTAFEVIDPAEYNAPDPADFFKPEGGLSSMLTELDDVESRGEKREGSEILRTYSGTLPGTVVKPVIPSADEGSSYKTTIGINEDGYPVTFGVTGVFFAADGDVTYKVVLDKFGEDVTITAPAPGS